MKTLYQMLAEHWDAFRSLWNVNEVSKTWYDLLKMKGCKTSTVTTIQEDVRSNTLIVVPNPIEMEAEFRGYSDEIAFILITHEFRDELVEKFSGKVRIDLSIEDEEEDEDHCESSDPLWYEGYDEDE